MYREALSVRKLKLWLAAALCPVAVQLAASADWWKGGAVALLSLAVVWAVWRWGRFSGWVSLCGAVVLVLYFGQILQGAAQVWKGNSYPAVPLFLLALAVWSAWKGAKAAACVGCVLFWAVLLIYPLVCGAAIRDVRWEWTKEGGNVGWELCLLLLAPTLGKLLLNEQKKGTLPLLTVVLTALSGLLTAGILGIACGKGFYEMVRAIDLLGVVKHFEALVSAAATLGWFALASFTLSICGAAGEMLGRSGRLFLLGGALLITVVMLCKFTISGWFLLLIGAVFWFFLPVLTQGIDMIKKRKKSKNDT